MAPLKPVHPDDEAWVGVDIGGTKTAIVIASQPPEILQRIEFPTLQERGPEYALKRIIDGIYQAVNDQQIKLSKVKAIGVSCGGPLDSEEGVIQAPPNLSTWIDVPITEILSREFGLPCCLENDANAGAVAEHRYGAGAGTKHMVFLTLGTGLGAGIIVDGRLYRGAQGQAGEIGHVRLSATGPIGYHKAGSAEGWASGGGIAQIARIRVEDAISRGESTDLSTVLIEKGGVTAKDVALAAKKSDPVALEIIQTAGVRLGEALAILIDVLNPERIVLGGMALRLRELILEPARSAIAREALPHSAQGCEVVAASLGERIGDLAALCVAQDCGCHSRHEHPLH